MSSTGIGPSTRWAMAVGCALSVGNLYYLQPLLGQVAHAFHVTDGKAGLAATLSQVGYALGMLLLVPLGDAFERRRLVIASIIATFVVLLGMAFAPTFPLLCVTAFLVGFVTVTPQLLIPFAAHLAPPEERGRIVGFVMSGLLIGILLARTVSGFVGEHFGWRTMYLLAAGLSLALALAMRLSLPRSPAHTELRYSELLRSLGQLFREEAVLRESAVYGAALFGSFSAFWTTLAFRLQGAPFHLGADVVGLFGLVGAAGALAAPLAGGAADRGGPRRTILIGILLVIVSFAVYLVPAIWALVVGVLLMDVGTQASHISNQSRIYARRPEARSRMNTVYMTAYFVGGSLGSGLGAWAWSTAGWPGVCAVGAGLPLVALATFGATRDKWGARPGRS